MKELLEFIVKDLVDDPSNIVITEIEQNNTISLTLNVSPGDMGKVIGKKGCISKSIRSILKASAKNCNKKVVFKII
jgi:uncharacterized protein